MSDALFDRLKAAQKRMLELQEKYNLLKNGELKVWEEKIQRASKEDLNGLAAAYHEWEVASGFAAIKTSLVKARDEYSSAQKAYDDELERRNVQEEERQIKESGLTEAEWRAKQAVNMYGYTTDWRDAGYLLKNGRLLNFTGEKGKHYGMRCLDHRNIGVLYASGEYKNDAAMTAFMNDGNIRVMFESPGIDMIKEPTEKQFAAIREMVRVSTNRRCFYVDFSDEKGKVVGSLSYEGMLRPERVINDIKTYFVTGKVPEREALPCLA